jgi:hypothetical protein
MLDLMATSARPRDIVAMSLEVARSPSQRDADNELYDRGCDLLAAAAAIRGVAGSPQAAPAIPAFLGCLEAALHELSCAAAAMGQTSASPEMSGDPRTRAVTDRMHRGFSNLNTALADAEAASRAARSLVARAVVAGAKRRRRAPR